MTGPAALVLLAFVPAAEAVARAAAAPPAAEVPPPGAGPRRSLDPARVEEAIRRATACLARDHDGAGFKDPYLRHTYLNDGLPAPDPPPGGRRITYRMVDADVLLALVAREGGVPPELAEAAGVAAARLESLLPIWRGLGPRNTSRGADPHGVALDTYCAVGWLHRDASMAAAAEAALDGDRWLPAGFHDGLESFRGLLDESWCLALLASTPDRPSGDSIQVPHGDSRAENGRGPGGAAAAASASGSPARRRDAAMDPGVRSSCREVCRPLGLAGPVLDRLAAEFRRDRERDPTGRGVFYEAWHLAMVLHELDRSAKAGAPSPRRDPDRSEEARPGAPSDSLRAEVVATLSDWYQSHRGARASRRDVLEWANLAAVEILAPDEEGRIREGALEQVLDWQEEDGCWSPLDASRPGRGRSFLTLRALLALARHRAS